MAGPLIEFVCIATAHGPRRLGEHASIVTVHNGRWAYCDWPAEEGHDWVAGGGVPLDQFRRHSHVQAPETRSA